MTNQKKPNQRSLQAYLYKVSNSGSKRLHIEIPSEDRLEFRSGSAVVVIPVDKQIQKSIEEAVGHKIKFAGGTPRKRGAPRR